jgi:hypothetical protein
MRLRALLEMAAPPESMRAGVLYHGTSDQAKAKAIMQAGVIRPGNTSGSSRRLMQPVVGASYLTPSLAYGVIYAIGGAIAGHDPPKNWLVPERRFGFLFVVPGSQIQNVQPDEDSVGEAVHHAFAIMDEIEKRQRSGNPWHRGEPLVLDKYYGESHLYRTIRDNADLSRSLRALAASTLTQNQMIRIRGGEAAYWAAGGKRMLKSMSDGMKHALIAAGAHVAHIGEIRPSEGWEIDKAKTKELAPDGSNFFEIARKVWAAQGAVS